MTEPDKSESQTSHPPQFSVLDVIPLEIWVEIFTWLDARTLAQSGLVCSTWLQASQQSKPWKRVSASLGLAVLPPACDDWKRFYKEHFYWRWDKINSSGVIFSAPDYLNVFRDKHESNQFTYGGVVGTVTWTSGRHHWQIQATGAVAEWSELGVVNRELMVRVNKFNGPGVFAFANDNQRYPEKDFATREFGRNDANAGQWIIDRYCVGDVVNIVFDADEHWISWSVKGQELLLMENLPPGPYSPFAILATSKTAFKIVGWKSIGEYKRLPVPLGLPTPTTIKAQIQI